MREVGGKGVEKGAAAAAAAASSNSTHSNTPRTPQTNLDDAVHVDVRRVAAAGGGDHVLRAHGGVHVGHVALERRVHAHVAVAKLVAEGLAVLLARAARLVDAVEDDKGLGLCLGWGVVV